MSPTVALVAGAQTGETTVYLEQVADNQHQYQQGERTFQYSAEGTYGQTEWQEHPDAANENQAQTEAGNQNATNSEKTAGHLQQNMLNQNTNHWPSDQRKKTGFPQDVKFGEGQNSAITSQSKRSCISSNSQEDHDNTVAGQNSGNVSSYQPSQIDIQATQMRIITPKQCSPMISERGTGIGRGRDRHPSRGRNVNTQAKQDTSSKDNLVTSHEVDEENSEPQKLRSYSESSTKAKTKIKKKPDRYCKFYDQIIKGGKLKRHIMRKHKSCLQDFSSKENENGLFDQIRKEGIHKFNMKLMANATEPTMRERIPAKEDSVRLCSECKGYFSNKYFFKHKCLISRPSPLKPQFMLSVTMHQIKADKEFHQILNRFQDDAVGRICRTNETIIIVGYRHFNLRRHEEGKEDEVRKVVMSEMRTIA